MAPAATATVAKPSWPPPSGSVVALGRNHVCTLRESLVFCRGDNLYAQVTSDAGRNGVEQQVPGVRGARSVVAGGNHTCAIVDGGAVYCWGLNQLGQTGHKTRKPDVVTGVAKVVQLALGNEHSCALSSDRTVRCWGRNGEGQLGQGFIPGPATVVLGKDDAEAYSALRSGAGVAQAKPTQGVRDVAQIVAGERHTCALTSAGKVLCWGDNSRGQLGFVDSKTRRLATPRVVAGLPAAVQIAARSNQTCALLADTTVRCWGSDELATRSEDRIPPRPEVVPGVTGVVRIGVGSPQACAITGDGGLTCWGGMYLGDGRYHESGSAPVKVALPDKATQLSFGLGNACVTLRNRKVMCWGYNNYRQLNGSNKRTLSRPVAY